jgi:hypothetical protein
MNSQQAATPVILVTAPNNKETLQQFLHRHTTTSFPTHHVFVNIETSQPAIDQNCLCNIRIQL